MGESRVSSGSGCRRAKGDWSRESMWTGDVVGESSAMVRGNVGSGSVGCGDGGGVSRLRWLAIAVSMISTAVSSVSVIVGVVMGVVMVVRERRGCWFMVGVVALLYIFRRSVGHRV